MEEREKEVLQVEVLPTLYRAKKKRLRRLGRYVRNIGKEKVNSGKRRITM